MNDSMITRISAHKAPEIEAQVQSMFQLESSETISRASYAITALANRLLDDDLADRSIVVLVGRAMKGGAGLAAARDLLAAGAWVQTICIYPAEAYAGTLAKQLTALQEAGAPLAWAEEGWELPPCDLLIDAMSEDLLSGDPTGSAREMILLANSCAAPILSIDVPSGVDADQGRCFSPHIVSLATLVLGVPKQGLLMEPVQNVCGELYLADVGIPAEHYVAAGMISPPSFAENAFLKLRTENIRRK